MLRQGAVSAESSHLDRPLRVGHIGTPVHIVVSFFFAPFKPGEDSKPHKH